MHNCPKCGGDCEREEVDSGAGTVCGPWVCLTCGWVDLKCLHGRPLGHLCPHCTPSAPEAP